MPIKSGIKNRRTGSTGAKAIKDAQKRITGIPRRMQKEIPSGFYGGMANMTRRFFRENYDNKRGWENPFYTSQKYMTKKDKWVAEGHFFDIGSAFKAMPCIFDSNTFGKLTGLISNTIGTKVATTSSTNVKTVKGGVNINVSVGIDPRLFEGGSSHVYRSKRTGRIIKDKKADNHLLAFSNRVTKEGDDSVFTKVWPDQRIQIKRFARDILRRIIKRVYVSNKAIEVD